MLAPGVRRQGDELGKHLAGPERAIDLHLPDDSSGLAQAESVIRSMRPATPYVYGHDHATRPTADLPKPLCKDSFCPLGINQLCRTGRIT